MLLPVIIRPLLKKKKKNLTYPSRLNSSSASITMPITHPPTWVDLCCPCTFSLYSSIAPCWNFILYDCLFYCQFIADRFHVWFIYPNFNVVSSSYWTLNASRMNAKTDFQWMSLEHWVKVWDKVKLGVVAKNKREGHGRTYKARTSAELLRIGLHTFLQKTEDYFQIQKPS